jgi:glycogen operon protein
VCHTQANGENNKDGENHNLSWNCGVEGPTEKLDVNRWGVVERG